MSRGIVTSMACLTAYDLETSKRRRCSPTRAFDPRGKKILLIKERMARQV
jgi:hypothetical protein